MPYKLCPNDPKNHKQFITVAHISQDWVVDPKGEFLEVEKEYLDTVASPNYSNTWTCKECGVEAVRPIELKSPEEQLAQKFIDAGYAKCAINEDDLKVLGIDKEPKTFAPIGSKSRLTLNSWERLCQFVYEKVSGKAIPLCRLLGKGSRSQWHGEQVAKAIDEKFNS